MRDTRIIESEIDVARKDLETNLAELKEVVREKLDVKQRAKDAVEERKQQAKELAKRGKEELVQLAHRGREVAENLAHRARTDVRERPAVAAIVGAALLLLGVLVVRQRMRDAGWNDRIAMMARRLQARWAARLDRT